MPIQAAANRLKREFDEGKTRSVQPQAPEEPQNEEVKQEDKGGKKGKAKGGAAKKDAAPKVEKVPPT